MFENPIQRWLEDKAGTLGGWIGDTFWWELTIVIAIVLVWFAWYLVRRWRQGLR
jgi:hypothetical protein